MSESAGPSIFISHAWHHEALYTALRDMLDGITEHRWKDLSIPRDGALDMLSSGAEAFFQEIELQERMIETLQEQRTDLEKQFEEELANIDRDNRLEERIETCIMRINQMIEKKLGIDN